MRLRGKGATTWMVTSRSPVFFRVVAPLPRRRMTVPEEVPGLILILEVPPSSSGTSTVAPRAASRSVTGRSMRRLAPSTGSTEYTGCFLMLMVTTMSPFSPPFRPARPLPRRRIFWPSRTPAGIRTFMVRPSAVSSTVVPVTASRRSSVAEVRTSAPFCGRGWGVKPPKPKGPERPPERVGLGVPPNMRSRSSRSGSPAEPPVSKRTLPPWPPNMEERMSSKPAPPAPPGPPAWKRAPPPAIERIASYCLRSASSDRTA